jgi:hypothetical protein
MQCWWCDAPATWRLHGCPANCDTGCCRVDDEVCDACKDEILADMDPSWGIAARPLTGDRPTYRVIASPSAGGPSEGADRDRGR